MPESLDQEIRTLQTIFWSEQDPEGLAFAPLADAFRRKGDVREALDLLTDGMSRHPDYATGHVIATRLYLDQGMHSEAELAARRVLKLDPENLVALSTLATVLAARGDTDEAARFRDALLEVDPASEEARAGADPATEEGPPEPESPAPVMEEGPPEPESPAPVMEATDFAPPAGRAGWEGEEDGLEITEPVPETMYREGDPDSLLDDLTLAPTDGDLAVETEEESEELGEVAEPIDFGGFDLEQPTEEPVEDVVDLASLAPDEPAEEVVDVASLAPDEAAEGPVGLASLAPDEPTEDAVDLASLAPDEPEDEVVDLASLAPDEPAEGVVDLASLAPDEPEEEVVDLASLAPDEPEEEVVDLASLAPDEPLEEVVDLASLAPDEPAEDAVDLASLAPDEPEEALPDEGAGLPGGVAVANPEEEHDEMSSEPVYTRTLADLYVKQGFKAKALEVLRYLQEREPGATDLAERIEALERGDEVETGFGGPPAPELPSGTDHAEALQRAGEVDHAEAPPTDAGHTETLQGEPPHADGGHTGAGHTEDDVEERARHLAEGGGDGDDVDTPFAWGESTEEASVDDEIDIGGYFESLLGWEDRAES